MTGIRDDRCRTRMLEILVFANESYQLPQNVYLRPAEYRNPQQETLEAEAFRSNE